MKFSDSIKLLVSKIFGSTTAFINDTQYIMFFFINQSTIIKIAL